MDFDKIIKFIVDHLANYFSILFTTLKRPILKFPPIESKESKKIIITNSGNELAKDQMNPSLFEFAFISIFIGFTIQSLIPKNGTQPQLIISVLIPFIAWLVVGVVMNIFCKLLRGKGSFIETISITLQIFSVAYVISSVLTLLWGIALLGYSQFTEEFFVYPSQPTLFNEITLSFYELPPIGNYYLLREYPFLLYFIIQPIFILVYFSWALKILHRFNRIKMIVIILILLILLNTFMFLNTLTYKQYVFPLWPVK